VAGDGHTPLKLRMVNAQRKSYSMRVTALEKNLLQSLLELEAAVKTMATANPKPNLLPIFSRLDALALELPRETDPNLRHYLNKKSYEKARLFLQGLEAQITPGACGHR
jgi:hypothetical protein